MSLKHNVKLKDEVVEELGTTKYNVEIKGPRSVVLNAELISADVDEDNTKVTTSIEENFREDDSQILNIKRHFYADPYLDEELDEFQYLYHYTSILKINLTKLVELTKSRYQLPDELKDLIQYDMIIKKDSCGQFDRFGRVKSK